MVSVFVKAAEALKKEAVLILISVEDGFCVNNESTSIEDQEAMS